MFMRVAAPILSVAALISALPFALFFVGIANHLARDHTSPYLPILAGLGWLAFANIWFFTLVRVLKCPYCGKRFGWSNCNTAFFFHVWPKRYCPDCSANAYQSREDYVRDGPVDLRKRA